MRRFQKALFCTFCFLLSMIQLLPASAETGYSWYCPHVKGHAQPRAGSELLFAEDYDAYYLDHSGEKVIYLTFDAGYENGNVEKVLDVLKENGVPGAFFILGNLITRNPELVKRMADEGHTVCNHTVHHRNMAKKSGEELLSELHELEELYQNATGKELTKFYRPPEGRFSKSNLETLKQNGYKTIFWSFAYPDWDNARQVDPERAKEMILANAHPGEVMLLHPTSDTNAKILNDVIRKLKEAGYRFGSLEELTK
ncbi:MAG: polysaccharide deacetylase family protein [Clostridia bacterium]|nr:polysaccharide deacetylase family protein [Clostridia bacterium]